MSGRDDGIRNPDGSFTLAYLAYLINTKRRKKRREDNPISGSTINLLDGLPWIQGTNTTMSIAGGRVRATATIGNTRVYKTVTGLAIGETYHLSGNIWDGTGVGAIFFRVSTAADLPDGNNYEQSDTVDFVVNADFVATATTLSVGVVKSVSNTGEWVEIDEDFSLSVAP